MLKKFNQNTNNMQSFIWQEAATYSVLKVITEKLKENIKTKRRKKEVDKNLLSSVHSDQ